MAFPPSSTERSALPWTAPGPVSAAVRLLPALLLLGCQATRPAGIGARDGRLAPCPATPNCVSSLDPGGAHRVAPLPYEGTAQAAWSRLEGIVQSLPRTKVVTDTGAYLHAECASRVFRFVDDLEFVADERARVIHVRSAARLGSYDFGVNRRRVEAIRARWARDASR